MKAYERCKGSVDIILASFNGEQFIHEQLRSLQLLDEYENIVRKIIVVDDGSTDETLNIVKAFSQNDKKIELYLSSGQRLGPMNNFCRGVTYSNADFVMFSDQDDVWIKNKLTTMLDAISGKDEYTPRLVFLIWK